MTERSPGVGHTILSIVGAAAFMGLFFALCGLLGLAAPAFGLLFLVYWAAILPQDLAQFGAALCGGLTGIWLGWLLVYGLAESGQAQPFLSALVVGTLLFCFTRGHARLIVNNGTMLLLTVATMVGLDVAHNAPAMSAALLFGAAYMGATALVVNRFARKAD